MTADPSGGYCNKTPAGREWPVCWLAADHAAGGHESADFFWADGDQSPTLVAKLGLPVSGRNTRQDGQGLNDSRCASAAKGNDDGAGN